MGVARSRVLVLVLSGSVLPSVALGATRTVCPSTCNFTTIGAALASSVSGDVLVLSNGLTYNEPNLTVNTNVTIRAATPGSGVRPKITSSSTNTLQVPSGRTLTIDYLEIANTNLGDSTEVWLTGGSLTASNTVFASHAGGAFNAGIGMNATGNLSLTDVTFGNMTTTSFNGGAAISANGNVSLTRVTALSGSASGSGTGGFLRMWGGGAVVLDECVIANYTAGTGGVIGVASSNVQVTVRNSDLSGTAMNNGGAIGFNSGGLGSRLDLIDTVIHDSVASGGGQGGGVYANSSVPVFITGGAFDNNRAGAGGAVWASANSDVDILNVSFDANTATNSGGGAVFMNGNSGGMLTVTDSVFSGNSAGQGGGAINSQARDGSTLLDNLFIGNSAVGTGGAVKLDTGAGGVVMTVRRNTFSLNASADRGGGLYVRADGTLALESNLFEANDAGNNGGGINVENTNEVIATRNTFCDNTANQGGGFYQNNGKGGSSVFANNVFAENRATGQGGGLFWGDSVPVTNNLFVGNASGSNGGAVRLQNNAAFVNNLVGATTAGYGASRNNSATLTYSGFWANTPNHVYFDLGGNQPVLSPNWIFTANPVFFGYTPGTAGDGVGCSGADFRLLSSTPSVKNTGDPSLTDLDGTRSDAGPFGGKNADPAWWVDGDNDGSPWVYDCDDANAAIAPGKAEVCNLRDENCNGLVDEGASVGLWYRDSDGDGFGLDTNTSSSCGQPAGFVATGKDCNDGNAAINPGHVELCSTVNVDDDCDGSKDEGDATDATSWYADLDADAYGNSASAKAACARPSGFVPDATDCDDLRAATNPAASELCNSLDDDCDLLVDDAPIDAKTWYADADADTYGTTSTTATGCVAPVGFAALSTDCNDADKTVNPGALEVCDHKDQDCDGAADDGLATKSYFVDGDKDGQGNPSTGVTDCAAPVGYVADSRDCDDASATVYTGAIETCNLKDDDCDGTIDDNVATYPFYQDNDGDGYGSTVSKTDCKAPAGYVQTGGDCNDGSSSISPVGIETCDGVDQDCDGTKDENAIDAPTWYADSDKDSFGSSTSTTRVCGTTPPTGFVGNSVDCDDKSASILDGISFYADADADGYGDPAVAAYVCARPAGYAPNSKDCNDIDAAVHPGAGEFCDTVGRDDDCDGKVDDADAGDLNDATTWYKDADNDTYGVSATTVAACVAPALYASVAGDCDDASPSIRPNAPEQCDLIDNNCDTVVDNNVVLSPWWRDSDGDGFGNLVTAATPFIDCKAPDGYIDNYLDCNDIVAAVNPNATELCNGKDDNCDALTDDADPDVADPATWYLDVDADGFGTQDDVVVGCYAPPEHAPLDGDCWDDFDPAAFFVNPSATEVCNGADDDCDGRMDENLATNTVYVDGDGDGYGDAARPVEQCGAAGAGQAVVAGDCDDGDADRNPDAVEVWYDGVDANCDSGSDFDQDGDGADALATGGSDCDDEDATVFPGAEDVANGVDDDCDGVVDGAPPPPDRDEDGLIDEDEVALGTDPDVADTDGDGVSDGDEVGDPSDPTDTDGDGVIDALDDDDDGDGLPSGYEGQDDTDGDGLPNDRDTDSDDDGISDGVEGPGDSDGDGITDRLDPDPVDTGEGDGKCGCATGSSAGLPLALLGLLLVRRRRSLPPG